MHWCNLHGHTCEFSCFWRESWDILEKHAIAELSGSTSLVTEKSVGKKKKNSTKMCLDLLVLSSLVSDSLHNPGDYCITDLWNSRFPGCLSSFSAGQLSPTLCDPKDCSMPGLPVQHQFQGISQNHVHWISDTIQPSHSLSAPSSHFSLSQHQGLFQWVTSLHHVAKVFKCQLQHGSF